MSVFMSLNIAYAVMDYRWYYTCVSYTNSGFVFSFSNGILVSANE